MAYVVNGETLPDEEIQAIARQLEQEGGAQGGQGANGNPYATAEDAAIAKVLVRQEALRRAPEASEIDIEKEMKLLKGNWDSEEAFQKELEASQTTEEKLREDIAMRLRVDQLLDEICASLPQPTDEECQAYYDAHREQFMQPERVRASHIVKHVGGNVIDIHTAQAQMKDLVVLLRKGTPFEELARRYSDCPDRGGDLGYFTRGQMVPAFEEVVFNLERYQHSDVFQTPFGLHIAKVYDKIPEQPIPFDQVKEQVREMLFRERENAQIDAFTESLRQQAEIQEA